MNLLGSSPCYRLITRSSTPRPNNLIGLIKFQFNRLCQFVNNNTCVCSFVKNVISDDLERGRKPSSPSDFCWICASSFAICLGNLVKTTFIYLWQIYSKVLHGVKLVNYNELILKHVLEFCI